MSPIERYTEAGFLYFAGFSAAALVFCLLVKAVRITRQSRWIPVLKNAGRQVHWFFEPVYPVFAAAGACAVLWGLFILAGWTAERLSLWPF